MGVSNVDGVNTASCGAAGSTGHGRTVCVTGAGGFIASWLVKLLLEKGYTVRGTVRNPDDVAKNAHLTALDGAAERLSLFRADLLDQESLAAAFRGCEGVFHTACPVTEDPEKLIEPAVNGTRNVLNAAADVGGIRRVVMTSSIGAVYMNSGNRAGEADETCWSDLQYCKDTKNWYCYAKTIAEQTAWSLAAARHLDLVVINPSLVLGPLLQPAVNASTTHIAKYLDGSVKTYYANAAQAYAHVRDVADAHARAYETPDASGRYLCAGETVHRAEVCRILGKLFPEYPVPTKCKGGEGELKKGCRFSNRRLKELGVGVTPTSQCLYETVTSLQDKGLLPKPQAHAW
ncbi:cinnamoyl-CoA reductase 2 [Brachypodium distachyon]|uniref:NAD-dependent epimerase/dehydratase domain-containing protein n=1 Tax=Brachypodium distachyon TaxID=15368 RepID=I1I2J1_BRADI|nr:cinnamoyl-CoA reductase 2 [Brachypodium distachyon]KQJ95897.1 hypothetical protein BRADI_3g19670v3 [Brachypodium distachyon]|eukprot:XP_003571608.1 cinnamoyl-CoA reductase 2 [Brachypodium distachyon]